jgi:hypothetical protein
MTKMMPCSQSTTLDLLLNTLERFSDWLKSRNECWSRNKRFALNTYKSYRKDKEWHSPDADMLAVAIAYNDALLVVEDLISDLKVALRSNPYPGEQKRLVAIAVGLFPDAGVRFEPGRRRVALKGEKLWRKIFAIGGVTLAEKICFPETSDNWDIKQVEEMLLQLVREDNTIPAPEVPVALNLSPNCKQYRVVKSALIERGWQWKHRRHNNTTQKVVVPPV